MVCRNEKSLLCYKNESISFQSFYFTCFISRISYILKQVFMIEPTILKNINLHGNKSHRKYHVSFIGSLFPTRKWKFFFFPFHVLTIKIRKNTFSFQSKWCAYFMRIKNCSSFANKSFSNGYRNIKNSKIKSKLYGVNKSFSRTIYLHK